MEGYGENVVLIAIGRGPPATHPKHKNLAFSIRSRNFPVK